MTAPGILWFRQDLRLRDNPALDAALAHAESQGGGLLLLYILDDETPSAWRIGGAGRWWLHHSLKALAAAVASRGGRLILRRGAAEKLLDEIVAASGAETVFWNRCYEPWAIGRDKAIKAKLRKDGLSARSFNGALLMEPWQLATKSGTPYQVFTPFWRRLRDEVTIDRPTPAPKCLPPDDGRIASDDLAALELLPRAPDWSSGLGDRWTPGENTALDRLEDFLDEDLAAYDRERDRPATDRTSRLSPHLHWGEISP
ncbi:MAG TPA: deoxyribodipyrimidine photo-lyase, partial [Kiloniellaceae bacterium]|nr:deoxyribodipyrimidine photo-lyase [Kiloniellaceae bacterium]